MLEDEAIREKEGREMEILSMAANKSKNKLEEYHSYQDGIVDFPLLSPELMEKNNE
jgi:hypothetical protein